MQNHLFVFVIRFPQIFNLPSEQIPSNYLPQPRKQPLSFKNVDQKNISPRHHVDDASKIHICIHTCHMDPFLVVKWHLHGHRRRHHSSVRWALHWYLHKCCSFSMTEPKMQRTRAEGFNLINISAQWLAFFVRWQQVGSVCRFISCTACWGFSFLHPSIHTGTKQKAFP